MSIVTLLVAKRFAMRALIILPTAFAGEMPTLPSPSFLGLGPLMRFNTNPAFSLRGLVKSFRNSDSILTTMDGASSTSVCLAFKKSCALINLQKEIEVYYCCKIKLKKGCSRAAVSQRRERG